MNLYIVGDLHGQITAIDKFYTNHIKGTPKEDAENWIICLGDFGANYYLDEKDWLFKYNLSRYPFKYFVIRGNHEQRAEICAVREPSLWEEVECFGGPCLRQPIFPNIYYANDAGGIYDIAGGHTLVIPGAYSVDKHYRLERGWSWFPDEQLAPHEMLDLEIEAEGRYFDLVLSHTCPYRYRPTDLFLKMINQSKVDNTMELWMDKLHDKIDFGVWCWGHYHEDRLEAPYCEMFFNEVEELRVIQERWSRYKVLGELDWWLPKSPQFYMFVGAK